MAKGLLLESDGQFIRDYIYILDAVNAYLCLAEMMGSKDICGEAFNFSNEVRLTVCRRSKKILKILNREDLKPVILNKTDGEIRHQYLSVQKAEGTFRLETKIFNRRRACGDGKLV